MNNNVATDTEGPELSETQTSMRCGQKSMWLVAPSFLLLVLSLGSIFALAQKFSTDLFVVNWLPWFVAGFFMVGWLLTHWLEIVAFRKQKRNMRILVLVIGLVSLFFGFYFPLLINHQVLGQFGVSSLSLIWSGCAFRMSLFHDENYVFLQKNNWLGKSG